MIRPFRAFIIYAVILTGCFSAVLANLIRYSLKEEFYSHILLIPVISGYLIWQRRTSLPQVKADSRGLALVPAIMAVAVLGTFFSLEPLRENLSRNDYLSLNVFSYYLLVVAGVLFFLGKTFARSIFFPLAFAVFIVPFPAALTDAMEVCSQNASAEIYSWMMSATGATYFRNGLTFSLPGVNLMVAQECSGIRSSFVLFLTSLLAGHMFLKRGWKKVLLSAMVIPLGFVRNAFRVYVLSFLSVHFSPKVLDGPLHHHGGPLFFLLSLIPFFALLVWLRRSEEPKVQPGISESRTAVSTGTV